MHVVTYLLSLLFGISAAEDSCHCTCTENNFVVSAGIITWRQYSKRRYFWLKSSSLAGCLQTNSEKSVVNTYKITSGLVTVFCL